MLFLGKAAHDLEEPRQFFTSIGTKFVRHALDHAALGNGIGFLREGGPSKARRQRLIDRLDLLDQQTVLDSIGESGLVGFGAAALADRLDFDKTRHCRFRKRGDRQRHMPTPLFLANAEPLGLAAEFRRMSTRQRQQIRQSRHRCIPFVACGATVDQMLRSLQTAETLRRRRKIFRKAARLHAGI